jgi:hypothetical protein|tara:strand:+ start:1958 stop:2227 length:270 start_codon:yes stop_codon:yes gene_type:complete
MPKVDDIDDSGWLDFELLPEVMNPSMTVTVYLKPGDYTANKGITFGDVYESSVQEELKVLYLFCGENSEKVVLVQDYSLVVWNRNIIKG